MTKSILSKFVRPARFLVLALIAIGAAGCGGGGGGGDTTVGTVPQDSTSVPPSAFASVASFIGYLNGLAQSDNSEPLGTHTGTPPASDSDEPTNLS